MSKFGGEIKNGERKTKGRKKKNKKGKKDDKTPQELPAKKMEDMTNAMLDDDYGMECLLNN